LEICPTVVANTFVKQSTERARESMQGGSSILEGFESVGLFPPMITSLIAIGEKTGSLDQMLDFVVAQYEMDVKYALKNLPSTIEPIVTTIMGLGVLFFALAVYLPIWNMSKLVTR
jgi:type II secretory pathway component PulF